ncbi:hypothetical protein GNI_133140 [Gregarina niphandrodes]|uniref:Uncharacterized protein n=1 Tax=Gregarina niphandrodes TaxID=110365 RepID=A0A023B146_GRENI|nr:hypothetical protein GNI_133140 [Gregarina niphandrodes]EZG46746.1 hypothetical protein GNI_133140 [Gregarina niphandrodes]|eukprot:XP_011132255.1 hypothetical protein GNI_133140 [Gregarina niphandrodes]
MGGPDFLRYNYKMETAVLNAAIAEYCRAQGLLKTRNALINEAACPDETKLPVPDILLKRWNAATTLQVSVR